MCQVFNHTCQLTLKDTQFAALKFKSARLIMQPRITEMFGIFAPFGPKMNYHTYMNVNFSRKDLYDLVWSTPLTVLAKKYNISDNGLRKMCVGLNIPLPRHGYWQKIKHGKTPKKMELPADSRDNEIFTLELVTEDTVRVSSILEKIKTQQKIIEDEVDSKLVVPDRLVNPDILIVGFKERHNASEKRDWSSKVYSQYPNALDISVTKENLLRALRFFDTLIKVLKIRGYTIGFSDKCTYVAIKGEKIEIRLREKNKITKETNNYGWTSNKYEPTGVLYFGVKASFNDKTWSDGERKIEEVVSNIIAYIEVKGEELHQRTIEWENERRVREGEKQKRIKYQELQDAELTKFKDLLFDVERWKLLKDLRAYIDDFESTHNQLSQSDPEIIEKINWMKKKADWYDPLIGDQDELLSNVDKESLKFKGRETIW